MDREPGDKAGYSRREFLKRAPLAVAAGFALGLVLGRPLLARFVRRRQAPVFPKGSIFTPANDPHDTA